MTNGWTGGQYSLFRITFSLYLLVELAILAWNDTPFVWAVAAVCAGLAIMLMLGWRDRIAASGLLAGWSVILLLQLELLALPGLRRWAWIPLVLLLAHGLLPKAPFGALDARRRVDPAGNWAFPPNVFALVWVGLALFYAAQSLSMLGNPAWRLGEALQSPIAPWFPPELLTWPTILVWLGFMPLALLRTTRPIGWVLALAVDVIVLPLAGYPQLAAALVMWHLLAFDPAWLKPRVAPTDKPDLVFFDGQCGLCHMLVRLALAEDASGRLFQFAPLQGETFHHKIKKLSDGKLPDSMVVRQPDGTVLFRFQACLHLLSRLGGLWRILSWALRLLPTPMGDWGYRMLAAVRHRLFPKPPDVCPVMPEHLRARFRP